MSYKPSFSEIEGLLYENIVLTKGSAPKFYLDSDEVDVWSEQYSYFHSKSTTDYIRDRILAAEKSGEDLFPDIVGKKLEKELTKNALFSGSPILFKGDRGFGKTTFSKAIAKLLPQRILAIKDCRIHDDPVQPVCFSCKWRVTHEERVQLEWVPRIWVRIPGDPMLTTRQLIGGISIQKLREGYELDHPEVFIPGRALKANRGVGYFDELGAIPSSMQTMLHELLEERQVTTSEGEIVPMRIDSVEIASTNPSNYKGTAAIKEPLLDRMETIEIGPPETVEEEMEIALRNMYYTRRFGRKPQVPMWHARLLTQIVRLGRDTTKNRTQLSATLSCRATIKLFDHVFSNTERRGGKAVMFSDYGPDYEMVRLALGGRVELEYGAKLTKEDLMNALVAEATKTECKHIYDEYLPREDFDTFISELRLLGEKSNSGSFIKLTPETATTAAKMRSLREMLLKMGAADDGELALSALEAVLNSLSYCSDYVTKTDHGYLVREARDFAKAPV